MNLEWSPLALERVSEIASYIALDKPSAAEIWVDGLFESVGRLKSHPMSGRKVPEVGIERIREIVYGAYQTRIGRAQPRPYPVVERARCWFSL